MFWFLRKRGYYVPSAGWLLFLGKLVIALFVLAGVLIWLGRARVLLALRVAVAEGRPSRRVCAAGAVVYFASLWLLGFRLADFNRREMRSEAEAPGDLEP
mgnify:CR=1 FL=1